MVFICYIAIDGIHVIRLYLIQAFQKQSAQTVGAFDHLPRIAQLEMLDEEKLEEIQLEVVYNHRRTKIINKNVV